MARKRGLKMANSKIISCRIFPGIGIARVGDSPDGYFVGPEVPGLVSIPEGGYKDGEGRIKRQAARFRVYGYDEDGKVVGEITPKAENVIVKWTVTVANRKASGVRFSHVRHDLMPGEPPDDPSQFRNRHISDRGKLSLPSAISGVAAAMPSRMRIFRRCRHWASCGRAAGGLWCSAAGVSPPTEGARPLTQYAVNNVVARRHVGWPHHSSGHDRQADIR